MADAKQQIMDQVRQQAAISNARALIEKVNEHCFERCVPKPGTSLSSTESTCYTHCMEKYMASWNIVSRQYLAQIQKGVSGAGAAMGGL
ncbi:hypothetical protein BAUCODRAFT_382689 [Baudoinia panamericana UAMH 10762]|uniref:Mitochondrial import inner membrane translocase subunit n=1 Tax=Baudoinia panamericana (strain UAMH 10762) TaxID=717646 RepID=M2NHN7_BAUPA|nr:uncharacterized protein BAUCODRAFT_382689 [Baudoinia panamericana UAMH 10762]EMC98869.1 hypothetical protein BAUCODRAFT_382689 [Baudoinia panamericana UAMH 10762]